MSQQQAIPPPEVLAGKCLICEMLAKQRCADKLLLCAGLLDVSVEQVRSVLAQPQGAQVIMQQIQQRKAFVCNALMRHLVLSTQHNAVHQ